MLTEVHAVAWGSPHNDYMGSGRATYGVCGWVAFLCNAHNDLLKVGGRNWGGGEERVCVTRQAFYECLDMAVDGMCVRYRSIGKSRVMFNQWKVDVIVFYRWALIFVELGGWKLSGVEDEGKLITQTDVDCFRRIEASVDGVVGNLIDMMAYLCVCAGDVVDVVKVLEGAAKLEGAGGGGGGGREELVEKLEGMARGGACDKAFGVDRFMGGGGLEAITGKGLRKVDVLMVNAFLAGRIGEAGEFFNMVLESELNWDCELLGKSTRLGLDVLRAAAADRHELSNWEYPPLSEVEMVVKSELGEALEKLK